MFKNMQLNRHLGRASYGLSKIFRCPIVLAPPRHLTVEVTTACNLRCPMCRLGRKDLGRDAGVMNYEGYKGLLDEVYPYVRRISFPWYGEPFAHKDFGRFVRYASDKGMVIHISTNGTLLVKSNTDYLVDCRIRCIKVAVDGLEQETYEVYRVGGSLADIKEGVRRLADLRKERDSKYPERIEMQFIIMKHNEHELSRVETFGKEIGADLVKIKTMHVERNEEGGKFLPTNPEHRRYDDEFRVKSDRQRVPGCADLWEDVVVTWDGTMGMCCQDFDCEYSPGNVFNEGFFEVWFGKKMQDFRRRTLREKESIPLCARCHRP